MIMFEGITITGDGMSVTAKLYSGGEIACSAEVKPNPWDEYDFLSLAADAIYKLRDNQQGATTCEFITDTPEEDVPPITDDTAKQLSAEELLESYKGHEDKFWNDFKRGVFALCVDSNEWSEVSHRLDDLDICWLSGDTASQWKPDGFGVPDARYGSYVIYVNCLGRDYGMVYTRSIENVGKNNILKWEDVEF